MRLVEPEYRIEAFFDPEEMLRMIEQFGRTCYKSEDKITPFSSSNFVEMLVRRGHWSVIEHCSASVRFINNRGFSHELTRHRLASYSQESTRYCDYGGEGDVLFIRPQYWPRDDRRYMRMIGAFQASEEAYLDLRSLGAKPEEARDALAIGLKTELIMTANLREWDHVFSLRAHKRAHPMMRLLMIPLAKDFCSRLPEVFGPTLNKLGVV